MKQNSVKLFLAAALLAGFAALQTFAIEPVVVTNTVRFNPTIRFAGVEGGSAELGQAVTSFLGACGWFDLSRDERADYLLTIRQQGNTLAIELSSGGAPVGSWQVANAAVAPRKLAKDIVDLLIEKTFRELKVRGFCNSRIAFCAETGKGIRNLYTCDIDGGDIAQITASHSLCVEPAWSPSGRSLTFSKYNRSGIDIMEITVAKPQRSRVLSALPGINAGAAISPDGSRLALILSPDHMVDLYVMNPDGSKIRLTKGISVEASPCWSPDGSRIAFVSDDGGAPRIHLIDAKGGNRKRLPSIGSDAITPDWSGDDQIVYAARVNGQYTLGVYDLKTGKNRRVTEAAGNWESPAWAADNRHVVCKRSDGRGKGELHVVDTRTGQTRKLLSTPYPLSMPAWSPCRKRD